MKPQPPLRKVDDRLEKKLNLIGRQGLAQQLCRRQFGRLLAEDRLDRNPPLGRIEFATIVDRVNRHPILGRNREAERGRGWLRRLPATYL